VSPDHLWQLRDDARPCDVSWSWSETVDRLRCGHTGYRRLEPPIAVTREVTLLKREPAVVVRDVLDGGGARRLVWRFHLAPGVGGEVVDGRDIRLRAGAREVWLQTPDASRFESLAIEDGWVSPSYGVRVPARIVLATARTPQASIAWRFGLERLSADALLESSQARTAALCG